jgi:hypothetical protein
MMEERAVLLEEGAAKPSRPSRVEALEFLRRLRPTVTGIASLFDFIRVSSLSEPATGIIVIDISAVLNCAGASIIFPA